MMKQNSEEKMSIDFKNMLAQAKENFGNINSFRIEVDNGILEISKERVVLAEKMKEENLPKLPIKFDFRMRDTIYRDFLKSVITEVGAEDKLMVFIALCILLPHFAENNTLVFHGSGHGKSVFIQIIKEFLGKENPINIIKACMPIEEEPGMNYTYIPFETSIPEGEVQQDLPSITIQNEKNSIMDWVIAGISFFFYN